MRQYSSQGEPIEIGLLSGHLLFLDPLYLDNIKEEWQEAKLSFPEENYADFIQQLEETFFPHGGGTLLGYLNTQRQKGTFALDISRIREFDNSNPAEEQAAISKQITTFALDSGDLLLLDMGNFNKLLAAVTFDDLVDATEGNFSLYQDKINAALGNTGWAYIQSPGMGAGFDLVGSGHYVVTS